MEKQKIKLFISYAHKDNKNDKNVSKFIENLKEHFKSSKKFEYELWADWKILIGDDWSDEIQRALKEGDFGLLLLSLPFINSDYIQQNELPDLLASGRALPIGFEQFNLQTHDLKGLKAVQIFRFNDIWYDRCKKNDKKDFIEELYHQIEQRLAQKKKN